MSLLWVHAAEGEPSVTLHGYTADGDWCTQKFMGHSPQEAAHHWSQYGFTPTEWSHPGECGSHCEGFGHGVPPNNPNHPDYRNKDE